MLGTRHVSTWRIAEWATIYNWSIAKASNEPQRLVALCELRARVEFVGQTAVMYTQSLEHLPDWLEGRLREDVVGVFGLVDEDRNHDGDDRPTAERSRRS